NRQQFVALAIANSLSETIMEYDTGRIDAATFQQVVGAGTSQLGVGLTVISPNGTVLATTHDSLPTFTTSNLPPELAHAFSGAVSSNSRDDTLFAAAPILHDSRDQVGVIWIDSPLGPIQEQTRDRLLLLIGATIAALLAACAFGWWLSGRIVRPLAEIQAAARQMAGGKLDARAQVSGTSSELSALGLVFNDMAGRIEALVERQRDFVANASHELRSPLATIKLRTEALADGTANGERARQYVQEIDQETTRLGRLVANLLTLSRIDSSPRSEPTEAINICDAINDCARAIQPRLHNKSQDFQMLVSDTIPLLRIHLTDLQLMVNNLLDNAIKYTPESGRIRLDAGWADGELTIEVCDNGIGIPHTDLPRVSERFFRVDRSRSTPGTGLGLALVAATARQYGGQLTVNSTGAPGDGTCARLALRPKQTAA
ncbi:MAG TPA: HAMP domain-containing sensor histidine kinase, partial [Aggregatilineales bacterium]|nr:HAMP domain-containing sensor histidine kinase [Aggregatilineales bacterium]